MLQILWVCELRCALSKRLRTCFYLCTYTYAASMNVSQTRACQTSGRIGLLRRKCMQFWVLQFWDNTDNTHKRFALGTRPTRTTESDSRKSKRHMRRVFPQSITTLALGKPILLVQKTLSFEQIEPVTASCVFTIHQKCSQSLRIFQALEGFFGKVGKLNPRD